MYLQRSILLAASMTIVAGCATQKPRTDDPWEPFNRKMFSFNDGLDRHVIRPVAIGYKKVTSDGVRTGVGNFFANLKMPITIANDVLQLHVGQAGKSVARFAVNTTVGVLGVFDPATHWSLPASENDFGLTLARWNVHEGPYLVLPIMGGGSLRDVAGKPVDSFFDPLSYFANSQDNIAVGYAPTAFSMVSSRAAYLDKEALLEGAFDKYALVRDIYRQKRANQISKGSISSNALEGNQLSDEEMKRILDQQREYKDQKKNINQF